MSVMVASCKGATFGVLLKNAEAIETMRKVDTLVVDKTGTLTEGHPRLTDVVTLDGYDQAGVLRLAASLERGSEHPLAVAITAGARDRGAELAPVAGFQALPGKASTGRSAPGTSRSATTR